MRGQARRDHGAAAVRRRLAIAGGVIAAAGVAAGAAALAGGDEAAPASAAPAVGDTAAVERRDLVERDELDGTLGYGEEGVLVAGASGTITRLRAAGAVVTRGGALYWLDGEPAAFLLYGRLPAWRDLGPGIEDGADVHQLERNLRALGHDPDGDMEVDGEWDWATTAAVERFQEARGLDEDGTLAKGEVVFRPGPTRIGEAKATAGQPASPGRELSAVSSTQRRVTVDLDATRQSLARKGDAVTVELPTGRTAKGRVVDVGKVAEQPPGDEGGDPTIEVAIALRGRAARGSGLDQAPVDVGFAVERREDVLAVPVKALLARAGGGFAVEVAEAGARRVVEVRPGLFADGYVEVEGDLREGKTVVTAR
jgi:peptidoglycan hydrolase-like protein with peptidoglycan-binding domain